MRKLNETDSNILEASFAIVDENFFDSDEQMKVDDIVGGTSNDKKQFDDKIDQGTMSEDNAAVIDNDSITTNVTGNDINKSRSTLSVHEKIYNVDKKKVKSN